MIRSFLYLFIALCALLLDFPSQGQPFLLFNAAVAVEASCGEEQQQTEVDVDRDGEVDRTVEFEECVLRTFDYDGTEKELVVFYTETNGDASDRLEAIDMDGDGTDETSPADIANMVADWTQEAWTTYLDYGFDDPLGRDSFSVIVYNMRPGLAGWCCNGDPARYHYNVPSLIGNLTGTVNQAKAIAYHEMWHASEWKGGFGGWVNEGTASNMTDHINVPVDIDGDVDYISRVRGFLGDTSTPLTSHAYNAALFWAYYMERTGDIRSEPDLGVDAMKDFWDNLASDGLTTLDNVIQGLGDGRDIRSIWADFTVANYAQEIPDDVPQRYRYVDEEQSGAPDYPAVTPDVDESLLPSSGVGPTLTDVQPWAARYFRFRPDPAVPIIDLEFRQDTNRTIAYTLLLIKDNRLVDSERHVGRHFVRSFPNDEYDDVVVVVSSYQRFVNFRYAVNARDPVLRILDPSFSQKAQAGDPGSPDKILVKTELLSAVGAGEPIAGADPDDFDIRVGGTAVDSSDIIASSYIQGQYWFLLRPPTQSSSGFYDLSVDFSALTDTEFSSVEYSARDDVDNMVIVDRSGSMANDNKMTAAQDGARLYVDSWRDGDQLGLVSYADTGRVDVDLDAWSITRSPALTAIDDYTADGGTSIGDALRDGQQQLIDRGVDRDTDDHDWSMVLLSDGRNTVDPEPDVFFDAFDDRKDNGDKVPRVHTIALGPDADRREMQRIADRTGGTYQFAAVPGASGLTTMAATSGTDLANELAGIYRVIGETVLKHQQVFAARGAVPGAREPRNEHRIPVESGVRTAVFVFNWAPSNAAAPQVELQTPSGTFLKPDISERGHRLWRVTSPEAGDWQMAVGEAPIIIESNGPNLQAVASGTRYLAEAALESDLTMDVMVGLSPDERLAGRAVPLLVSLAGNAPITDATITANVTGPDGTVQQLTLHDDGRHGDGKAGDGFYGTRINRTATGGSYVVAVNADGVTPLGEAFQRRARRSFDMAGPDSDEVNDGDGDGLPDWWEDEFGTGVTVPDADEDPDKDGLTNGEEFEQGTHPNDPDSDGSGESDGSEVSEGNDPNDPADDAVACPLMFHADNHRQIFREEEENPRASVLSFGVDGSHDHFRLWRSTSPEGPWLLIDDAVPPTGEYLDHGVTLGTTYYYLLQAVTADGRTSCVLGPRSTTPREDAFPPEGLVVINDHAPTTQSLDVVLSLDASPDTVDMQVSNSADFSDVDWRPFEPELDWRLEPRDNRASVFARFRDNAGNVSELVSDSIRIVPTCDEARPSQAELWQPRHDMRIVTVDGVTDPDGDPVTVTVNGVFQDEPVKARGDGNTCPDARLEGVTAGAEIRAERSGRSDGRVYHLEFSAEDDQGASCTGSVQVCVPVNQGRNGGCEDQGPRYDATQCPER